MKQEKIAIVVDSGCDVPKEWLEKDFMFEVPLQITIDDQSYFDRQNIATADIYQQMGEGKVPKTSLPQGSDIESLFDRLAMEGYTHVLVCAVSSQLSGTYQLFKLMAEEHDSLQIHVFDTKNMSIGAGMFAIHAAKLLEQGWKFAAIVDEVCQPARSRIFGEVETLKYLNQGGRISHLSATLGSVLNIKPLLTIDEEGKVVTLAKVKGRKRMARQFREEIGRALDVPTKYVVAIEGNDDLTAELNEALDQYPELTEVVHSQIGAAFGVHVGPKVTVVVVYRMYD